VHPGAKIYGSWTIILKDLSQLFGAIPTPKVCQDLESFMVKISESNSK